MKRLAGLLAAALIMLTAVIPAAALQSTLGVITATLPDNYLILTRDNLSRNTEALKSWGHSVDSFKRLLNEKDIYLYAVDDTGANQFQLKSWTSDAAVTIGDLSNMDAQALADSMAAIGEGIAGGDGQLLSSEVVTRDDHPFFKFTVRVGEFCYVQYLTVCGGEFYAVVYYNDSPKLSDAESVTAEAVFASVKVDCAGRASALGAGGIITVILLGAGVILAAVGIIWVIFTFVEDIRRRRNEPDEIVPDHIEMRRK